MRDGTHTLLTAQRRMGKTSLVRELQDSTLSVPDVLHVLCHDGYLYRQDDGYQFVSGLLEDWWRSRYGQHFVSVPHLEVNPTGSGQ